MSDLDAEDLEDEDGDEIDWDEENIDTPILLPRVEQEVVAS